VDIAPIESTVSFVPRNIGDEFHRDRKSFANECGHCFTQWFSNRSLAGTEFQHFRPILQAFRFDNSPECFRMAPNRESKRRATSHFWLHLNPTLNVGSPFHSLSQRNQKPSSLKNCRSWKMRFWRLGFIFVALLSSAIVAPAQVTTGNIIGTVHDQSGAVLPGVSVTLTSPALPGGPRSVVTDERGEYRFTGLQPSMYSLTVELPRAQPNASSHSRSRRLPKRWRSAARRR
jgi:hypothetical protein